MISQIEINGTDLFQSHKLAQGGRTAQALVGCALANVGHCLTMPLMSRIGHLVLGVYEICRIEDMQVACINTYPLCPG